MPTLETTVNGLKFPNPFVIGSGPPSTNATIMNKAFAAGWGGVVAKTTALSDTPVVNVQPRYGKLRSPSKDNVGFQNIELISDLSFEDWEDFFKRVKDTPPERILIGSIMESFDKGRWQEVASRSFDAGCDALELNFSCPHGHPERGMGAAMGQDPERVETVTRWVSEVANGRPIWAKMTPNITDITAPSRAALAGGADGVSAINTILACIGINLKTLKPQPTVQGYSTYGGYSYYAVKPIALRMVSEIARSLPELTISGIGGVTCANDAIEHMLVGAHTVQSCTGPMLQGFGMVDELIEGTLAFMEQHGFETLDEFRGASLPFFTTHHHLVELQAEKKAKQAAKLANKDTEWGKGDVRDETAALTSNE
ncbi:MAG: NAD-dependent dihydropyrimidine dehydrogenase subunit PreA [Myxococcota bacterium]|nr:NAD-dependent dihydropyrimidine dehydrogenase subunit PreA [Myxococcota bacterium]